MFGSTTIVEGNIGAWHERNCNEKFRRMRRVIGGTADEALIELVDLSPSRTVWALL